ncbi:MAG: hypothetical protein V3V16_06045 [Melioribacteraceae bacterium]
MINSKNITVKKSARYFTLGNLSEKTKTVWFVFHGYGQLANEFIDEFKTLENDSTFIVAPEALNKFYLRGFTGKIGATWMTKEDRENEIHDYVQMINEIFTTIEQEVDFKNIKINILGFSQGSHTVVRWLDKYHNKINNLLLWGTSFPRDCEYKKNSNYWKNIKTKIMIGTEDRFISKEMFEKEKVYLQTQNLNFKIYNFSGGHIIDKKLLSQISNEM